MNTMKTFRMMISCLLAALLLFNLAACGAKQEEAPAAVEPVAEPEPPVEPEIPEELELPEEPEEPEEPEVPDPKELYPVLEFKEFYFVHEGTKLTTGMVYETSRFADTEEPVETPDCRTGNMSVMYSYEGFGINTIVITDQETGESESPIINTINLESDAVGTPEGIRVGSTLEEMFQAYGSGYSEDLGGYTYTAGAQQLTFYPDSESKVMYITYSLDETSVAEGIGEVEEETVPVTDGEPAEDYPGITFEGLHTRIYPSFKTENDYVSGVKAYDEYGNEIPYTYEIIVQNLVTRADYGPGVVIFTATDREGHTARAWQSIIIETYTEKDQAVVEQFAAETSDDIFEIKTYVRNSRWYVEGYYIPSPISRSAATIRANCYTYARLLQSVLEYKGYHAIILWSANNMHFWVLVETEDGWRHIDAIRLASKYKESEGLMTDEERLTLHGNRPWDTTIWPPAYSISAAAAAAEAADSEAAEAFEAEATE